ncbi:fluoride efflux transporter CrcB [Thalassoglobus sp.]|uniref:fluoride efflux transporter CrcB n=1 Tax=Thalassoglobus sp. TaxID=2795869 RepID=UPI003AA8F92E
MHWLAVALGGSLGAMARYALSSWMVRKFPMGTFFVNIAGCFLIGLILALSVKMDWPSPRMRAFLVGGFLGSLTTFSTFAYESVILSKQESLSMGVLNLAANLIVGLLFVWGGIVLGEAIAASSITEASLGE